MAIIPQQHLFTWKTPGETRPLVSGRADFFVYDERGNLWCICPLMLAMALLENPGATTGPPEILRRSRAKQSRLRPPSESPPRAQGLSPRLTWTRRRIERPQAA